MHAAGDGDQVVQQVVVAQAYRPRAAMAAVPADHTARACGCKFDCEASPCHHEAVG